MQLADTMEMIWPTTMTVSARSDKRRSKSNKTAESRHLRWKVLLLAVLTLVIIFHFEIEDVFLKKYGTCAQATVTNGIYHLHGDKDSFYYSFTVGGKEYHANSYILTEQSDQVGSKICVVYLPMVPDISRSVSGYFKSDFGKCGCK